MIGSQVVDSGVLTLEPDRSRRAPGVGAPSALRDSPRLSETSRRPASAGKDGAASSRPVPASAGAGMLHIRLRPVLNRTAESRGNGISTSTGAPLPCAQTPSAHMGARQLILTVFEYPQNSNERPHWLRKVPALPCAARPQYPPEQPRPRAEHRRPSPGLHRARPCTCHLPAPPR